MKVPSELNLFLTFLDHITLKNFQILPTENHRRDLDSCGMWGVGEGGLSLKITLVGLISVSSRAWGTSFLNVYSQLDLSFKSTKSYLVTIHGKAANDESWDGHSPSHSSLEDPLHQEGDPCQDPQIARKTCRISLPGTARRNPACQQHMAQLTYEERHVRLFGIL